MDAIKLVDKFVEARRAEGEKYGDSVALGAMKALLCSAIEVMEKVVGAYDHEDPIEIVASMRYPVMDCETFIKYIEEKANV